MSRIHTHYDNLKVARNAPPDVIRAAYRVLSQKFHPDRNQGNPEASRIMAIINTSYEVLSDPAKRRAHDLWIVEMEATSSVNWQTSQASHATTQHSAHSSGNRVFLSIFNFIKRFFIEAFSFAIRICVGGGVIFIIISAINFFGEENSPTTDSKPYQATSPSTHAEFVRPKYVRPSRAPNGQPWPTFAGYVKGYQQFHTNGLSTVTIDNSRNNSDVFVKLISQDGAKVYPVRQFYIPAFSSFTLNKVNAGSYDIRYRDLSNGGLSRSESFRLEEIQTYDGTRFSNIRMTLYKVQNGNMETYALSEAEF